MGEFTWTSGAEGSHIDSSSEPESGFAALGLEPSVVVPVASQEITQETVAPVTSTDAPLTRRELRAREQAALAAAQQFELASASASAPARVAEPAALLSPVPIVIVSDVASHQVRAPRKPKILRPVRLPRGIKRPLAPAPSLLRASVAPSKPKPKPKPFKRRALKKMMTFGAMIGAGLMMVATSVPANAFYSSTQQTGVASAPAAAPVKIQSISVEPAADLSVSRDSYTATSFREQIFLRYGSRSFLYTNDPNGTIQWPFPIAVPITDGWGPRIAPCGGCSTFHKGVDFTPGFGAAIQAIADGVVSAVISSHDGLGNHVIIDHMINGQLVQSVYAHMEDGSMRVVVGQVVKVKDIVGLVGTTGESTGPHLHFEIHIGGEPVDPFAWLKANAN